MPQSDTIQRLKSYAVAEEPHRPETQKEGKEVMYNWLNGKKTYIVAAVLNCSQWYGCAWLPNSCTNR